jgi:hypothetical protein
MTLIKNKYLVGSGDKKVLSANDVAHVENLVAETFNMSIDEVENEIGFYIEKEYNGIQRVFQIIKPTNKFYVNDNEFISFATRFEDGKTVITVEDEETGDYSDLIDTNEWG